MIDWEQLAVEQRNALFHEKYTKQAPWCQSSIGYTSDLRCYRCEKCNKVFDLLKHNIKDLETTQHLHSDVPHYCGDFNALTPYIDDLYNQRYSIEISINPSMASTKYTVTIGNHFGSFVGESESHIGEAMVMALLRLDNAETARGEVRQ